jgi:hypothetical protein
MRRAEVHGAAGFGVTWFLLGCGRDFEAALDSWQKAMGLGLPVVMTTEFWN